MVTTDPAPWVLGPDVEIIPVNTIHFIFDVHFVHIEKMSQDATYELVLYANGKEQGQKRFTRTSKDSTFEVNFKTRIFPAESRISCRLASASGGCSCWLSITYYVYP
jgi:hypothetical protein